MGRDDHCGFAPVQQLLFKIRASRKVIVVLSKNYGQSNQGKYVLSVLDTLHYQTRNDRVVIVTFENDLKVRTLLLRRQRKEEPWSQLQFLKYTQNQGRTQKYVNRGGIAQVRHCTGQLTVVLIARFNSKDKLQIHQNFCKNH